MFHQLIKNHYKNILVIIFGSFIFALGVNYFAIPNELSEGGFTGITLILFYLFGFSPGWVNLILNLPLFFVGYKVFGTRTLVYTIIGITFISIFLGITETWGEPIPGDPLLAALYTGVLVGVGLGMIFRVGGTSGGSAIIARLGNKYLEWSIGRAMLLFDLLVVGGSAFIIGRENAMYTLVSIFIGARVIDFVIEGLDARKAVTIISGSAVSLSDQITNDMHRGVTLLKGRGGYTGTDKEVIYIIINRQELPRMKQLVNEIDPYAFVVVHDVRDVLGEGFTFEKT
ncbi:YitT family protein [Paludifilum halophilum]|uniref:YitT family protein n=1 Tax=Paludifilum halophilum TaxID=1642702 RepID=UPI001F0A34E8|nr:YitT family protein [Paludifilum halophilum]